MGQPYAGLLESSHDTDGTTANPRLTQALVAAVELIVQSAYHVAGIIMLKVKSTNSNTPPLLHVANYRTAQLGMLTG